MPPSRSGHIATCTDKYLKTCQRHFSPTVLSGNGVGLCKSLTLAHVQKCRIRLAPTCVTTRLHIRVDYV